MDLWVLLLLLRQWKKTFVHGILSRDKANACTYTSRSWVPEGLFLTTKLKIYPFSPSCYMHDASDIADCSCRHMSHVTSVLEHRSPKCKGPGSRGRGVLFNHERERGGEQIFRPVIVQKRCASAPFLNRIALPSLAAFRILPNNKMVDACRTRA